ncbi:MAG: hypothetical protein ACKVU2_08435 [Saprospiraceae bacterium]
MTDYAIGVQPLHGLERAATDLPFLHTNVEFGVLQVDGSCLSIGICRITTTHCKQFAQRRAKPRRCPVAEAELSAGTNGRLRAFFPKSGMLPCTERAFFSRRVFPVPVPYILPNFLQAGLPDLAGGIIPAGLYPVRPGIGGYWIEF